MALLPLQPCPFCGGGASLRSRGGYAWITCAQCGMETKKYNQPGSDSMLFDLWNRRAGPGNLAAQAIQAALEELAYIDRMCQVKNEKGDYIEVHSGVIEMLRDAKRGGGP